MTDDFVRQTMHDIRHVTHSRESQMTWRDIRQLFNGKIDERITDHYDYRSIWGSNERFTWLVDEISVDQSLDFKIDSQNNGGREWFTVNVAECCFPDRGEKYVLSMGAGTQAQSQNLWLTLYRQNYSMWGVVWRCQICIRVRGEQGEWQAGTVFISRDEDQNASIGSLHMKSNNGVITDEVYIGGDGKTPEYSATRWGAPNFGYFAWSNNTEMIWPFAFYRFVEDTGFATIEEDFLHNFPSFPFFYLEGDTKDDNPNNLCSIVPYTEYDTRGYHGHGG
jgi:hypothetical protein